MNAGADKPNGRGWVRLKLTFTDRVMDDKGVPPIPFKLAAALARYADAETGIVDRSQAFLADVVNVKLRTLQLAIDLLVDRGHVVVLKPKGRKLGNRYRPMLRPKDDPDPVHMHGDAHEEGPVHMYGDAHEAAFHAHETAVSYAPPCASLTPVKIPVIDHPVADATASPPSKTTIADDDDGLLDEIATAIEAAGGKLAKRRHNLQPVRDLIAGGIAVDVVLSVVAGRASKLRGPLGNLDAPWLLDAIRDRAAADGYGSSTSAPSSVNHGATVSAPLDPTRYVQAGGATHSRARVEAAVGDWERTGTWSFEFGPPPDDPRTELPPELRREPRKPKGQGEASEPRSTDQIAV